MAVGLHHPSLTRRLVLPVVALLLAAVLANVAFAAWLAARRSVEGTRRQQERVAAALAASRVSLSMPVLDALHRLTGSHFLVWNATANVRGLSTLPAASLAAIGDEQITAAVAEGVLAVDGQKYRIGVARSEGVRPETVLVLTPQRSLWNATFESVWPVLAVAAATLAVLVPLGLKTTVASRTASVPSNGTSAGSPAASSAANLPIRWRRPAPTRSVGSSRESTG